MFFNFSPILQYYKNKKGGIIMSIFNILLTIHILFGTICLITGIVAMVAQKKKGKHTEWGEIYHASYVVITHIHQLKDLDYS